MTVSAPDPVELDLTLDNTLVPGQEGTARITLTVNEPLPAAADAVSPFPVAEPVSVVSYLMSVSAQVGMVRDAVSRSFQTDQFILAQGLNAGVAKQVDLVVKGVGGPNSDLGLSARILAPSSLLDVQRIFTDTAPGFTPTSTLTRIGANLSDAMGATVEAFTNGLTLPANRLSSFGLSDSSASAALALAMDVAGDFGSLAERATVGSLGTGWSSIADLGLSFDGTSVQLRGLTDFSALEALSVDAAAVYAVSNSADRAVSLGGATLALSTPMRPVFEATAGGRYTASAGFDGTLSRQGEGYRLDTGSGQTLSFDGAGAFLSMVGRDGRVILATHDSEGRISALQGPTGDALTFTRATTGRVERVTDADNRSASFTYDGNGQLQTVTRPEGQPQFTYTAAGDLSTSTAPGGIVSSFAYDSAGRLATAAYGGGTQTESFAYDQAGQLTITDGAGRSSQIDLLTGGVTGRVTGGDGQASELIYDGAGQLVGLRAADGTVTSVVYDEVGRLEQVTDANGGVLSYSYGAQGDRPLSFTGAGSATRSFAYDEAGRLVAADWADGTGLTFTYDAQGNLTRIIDDRGTTTMAHDSAGRVTRIDMPDGQSLLYIYTAAGQRASISDGGEYTLYYDYDAAGNRTRVVEDGVETLYTANALNQYTAVGDATFTYDADGNMLTRTDPDGTTTYAYDISNRLTSVTHADGTVLTFTYDAFGNRVGKTVDGVETTYLVDPFGLGDVVAEYTEGTLSATYAHGLGLAQAEIGGLAAWYDADAVGTVTTLTGADGSIANRYAFTPFGTGQRQRCAVPV